MSAKWQHGKGFRITGYVTRKFTPPTRKCCFLPVETPGDKPGKQDKTEMVAFQDLVEQADALGVGEVVQVTGSIGSKLLTDKARKDVQVDGKNVWVLQLIVRTIAVEGKAKAEAPKEPEKKLNNWEAEDKKNGIDW